jgi:N-acetyl-anhydromuramyl-L-alanine amidase AmpD
MKWIGSPNYDKNRTKIDTIFIHWIVGTLSSADAQFQKTGGTSAHYGIEDDKIHQYVKEEHVAYHAGVYSWNQRSIGIEHSADPNRPASELTYQTSGRLIAEIASRHGIPLDREHIKGHKEVRATQCPGTMDIDRLISIAKNNSTKMVTIPQAELDQLRHDRDKNWNSYQACENSVAGHKSRVTDLENQLSKSQGELAVEKEKHKITKQELAETKEKCYAEIFSLKAEIDELSKTNPDLKEIEKRYGEAMGELDSKIILLQDKVNKLKVENAKLQAPFKNLNFWDRLRLLF